MKKKNQPKIIEEIPCRVLLEVDEIFLKPPQEGDRRSVLYRGEKYMRYQVFRGGKWVTTGTCEHLHEEENHDADRT